MQCRDRAKVLQTKAYLLQAAISSIQVTRSKLCPNGRGPFDAASRCLITMAEYGRRTTPLTCPSQSSPLCSALVMLAILPYQVFLSIAWLFFTLPIRPLVCSSPGESQELEAIGEWKWAELSPALKDPKNPTGDY